MFNGVNIMDTSKNLNPNGAEILPCVEDAVCEITTCAVCASEIPLSAGLNEESSDYIQHFCGLDCLQIWQKQPGAA